jgi:hypothetical protein
MPQYKYSRLTWGWIQPDLTGGAKWGSVIKHEGLYCKCMLNRTSQKSNSLNSCSCYCKNFASQLKRIEDDLLQLRSRMNVREIEGLKLPCDNTSLRKEKDRLQSELELAKSTI